MPEQRFKSRLLNNLWDLLDEIEEKNEWEYGFVTNMMERDEKGLKMTDTQFNKLNEIHNRYVLR